MIRNTRMWLLVLMAALTMAVAACGGGGQAAGPTGSAGSASGGAGTGTLQGNGQQIVAFTVSTSNNYLGALAKSMQAEADKLGYQLTIIDNKFDQTEQDQQIRQFLASGQDVAAFIYWPANNDAGVNSARLLSQKAPVFQLSGVIKPEAEDYITARVGQDNLSIGKQMGTNLVAAIDAAKASGTTFHGPNGTPNVLEVTYPAGYEAGIMRHEGWTSVAGDKVNLLATENTTTPDAQGGFTAANQVIPKYKEQGIDFVVAGSNNQAAGVVKALQQNGLNPGQDVIVVAGDFSGDKQPLKDGLINSAVLQSPVIEGTLAVQTIARYLSTGQVVDGSTTLDADPVEPELSNTPPTRFTIMPNPPITQDNYATMRVWGRTVDELEF